MSNDSIDKRIKQAELQRVSNEAKKLEFEYKNIAFQLEESQRKKDLKWYRKSTNINVIFTSLISVTALGFYIQYFIMPSVEYKNIQLSTQNARKEQLLQQKEVYQDSLEKELDKKKQEIAVNNQLLERSRDSIKLLALEVKNVLVRQQDLQRKFRELTVISNQGDTDLRKQLVEAEDSLQNLKTQLTQYTNQIEEDSETSQPVAQGPLVEAEVVQALLLERYSDDGETTLGRLFDITNGKMEILAFTLEDTYREVKVSGETRIPSGEYLIQLNTNVTALTERYRNLYAGFDFHLQVMNVPDFNNVYIHPGNTAKDTNGAVLVGEKIVEVGGRPFLYASKKTYLKLYERLRRSIDTHGQINLTIKDGGDS